MGGLMASGDLADGLVASLLIIKTKRILLKSGRIFVCNRATSIKKWFLKEKCMFFTLIRNFNQKQCIRTKKKLYLTKEKKKTFKSILLSL